MLSRTLHLTPALRATTSAVLSRAAAVSSVSTSAAAELSAPRRFMATEKQLKMRIKSVNSIRKITKAMKMVAAAKLRVVQAQLEKVREFQKSPSGVWDMTLPEDKKVKKRLLVPLTSDRGLCGGVNSVIVRRVRRLILDDLRHSDQNVEVFVVGEKGRAGLERLCSEWFRSSIIDLGKMKPVTFTEAALLSELVLSHEFDQATFFFNRFKSAIVYYTVAEELYSLEYAMENRDQWDKYNFEGEKHSVLENLYEFRLAVRMFHMLVENSTSEQSARMTAMDNSSKNAGEMIHGLKLLYNRSRQSRITTELIEIISGASAAEEMTS